jgi:hypothetical protein
MRPEPLPNHKIAETGENLSRGVHFSAACYGISSEKLIDGKPHRSYFADYYVWKNGIWHVYFAQQTSFAV